MFKKMKRIFRGAGADSSELQRPRNETPQSWNRFNAGGGIYSVDHPEHWRITDTKSEASAVQITAPAGDLSLNIFVFRATAEVQEQDLANLLENFLDGRPIRGTPSFLQSAEWNGLEAELDAGPKDHPRTRWKFRALHHGTRIMAAYVNADVDTYTEEAETIERVFNSIRIQRPE
jgi:hypothetical protein